MREDLKTARRKAGITQAQLAERVGVTQDVISRYESGKRSVDLDVAPKIAKVLRISVLAVLYSPAERNEQKAAA